MHDRDLIWTTERGVEWKLKDMTTSHLINCLWHVKKRRDQFKEKGTYSPGLYKSRDLVLQAFRDEIAYRIDILGDALSDFEVEEQLVGKEDA